MRLIDIEYDGTKLSDLGFQLCTFDSASDVVVLGNELDMHETRASKADSFYSIGAAYNNSLEYQFAICRNYCEEHETEYLTENEINSIMRWINRKSYCKMRPIYDDGSFSDTFFMAAFNAEGVLGPLGLIGFNLTMKTNAPYGYRDPVTITGTTSVTFNDISDEMGTQVIDLKVALQGSGTLELTNSFPGTRKTIVNNCLSGETITFTGKNRQIQTSNMAHDTIYNDFNYVFPAAYNNATSKANTITSSLPCQITVTYCPIRKVGVIF